MWSCDAAKYLVSVPSVTATALSYTVRQPRFGNRNLGLRLRTRSLRSAEANAIKPPLTSLDNHSNTTDTSETALKVGRRLYQTREMVKRARGIHSLAKSVSELRALSTLFPSIPWSSLAHIIDCSAIPCAHGKGLQIRPIFVFFVRIAPYC